MAADPNIAACVERNARATPSRAAVIEPDGASGWRATACDELARRVERIALGLSRAGLARGDRVCVFVRPSATWVALTFALLRLGAVPVMIDPGMGRRGVLRCVERVQPRGLVGIPLANALRLVYPSSFASVEVAITAGRVHLGRGTTLARLEESANGALEPPPTSADDAAAVLFTSGATGPAKGAVHTHAMLAAQVASLRELYSIEPGGCDLACFPLFALFAPLLGLTSVLPRIDFTRPGTCDPAQVVRAATEHGAVQAFGSPAIWRRVAPWCAERGARIDSLHRLMIAGAPVSPRLVEACALIVGDGGDVHTPYGATEALPVSSASGSEILARRGESERGAGTWVGRLAPLVEARAIRVSDEPIAAWRDDLAVAPGEPGELAVRGPMVTREYASEPELTAAAKIRDGATVWHRMGDVVRVQRDRSLWFLGRKSHRVETERGALYPQSIENVFELHPAVARSALVGVGPRGRERPYLVVEPRDMPRGTRARADLAGDITRATRERGDGAAVEGVLFHRSLPVDRRHNAKIDRAALKRWAESELA